MSMPMRSKRFLFFIAVVYGLVLQSCYRQESSTPDGWIPTEEQVDSVSFYTTHHYTQNYNFIVTADSLQIIVQQPSEAVSGMMVDTLTIQKDDCIVVADIVTLSIDTIDSVWVQVARDQQTIGWIHEKDMLERVSPDNAISRFIDFFSDTHLLITLAGVVLCVALLVVGRLYRNKSMMVYVRDINSFYPTLLTLLISAAALFYSTIQLINPDSWRHFYYHPTLNPFEVPLHLELFLFSVWAIFIVSIAAFDDIRRQLPALQAFVYCVGLLAVCSVDYVIFSVSTLYYVGYPLFAVYAVFVLWRYFTHSRLGYRCGHCGQYIRKKGRCPHCGAINV